MVVGQAESCLLHGIYGSQLDGYAVLGRREQLQAEAPSSLRRGVLVTPVVFPCRPPHSCRTRLSVGEALLSSYSFFLFLTSALPRYIWIRDPQASGRSLFFLPSASYANRTVYVVLCRDTPWEKNARCIYDRRGKIVMVVVSYIMKEVIQSKNSARVGVSSLRLRSSDVGAFVTETRLLPCSCNLT